jgi:hypothetical protein
MSPPGLIPPMAVRLAIPPGQALHGTSIGAKLNDCASLRALSNGSEQPIVISAILKYLLISILLGAACRDDAEFSMELGQERKTGCTLPMAGRP